MKDEALKMALEALKSAAAELYRASSYCNTYEVIGNTNDVITAIQKALAAHPAVQEPVGLIDRLKHPEQHYEFTDPKKANAVLMSLCQEAADALAVPVQPMAHIVGEIDHTGKVWKPVQPAPVQDLPFGVGGGLVAIKTLLSRDPCVHANTAIEMIDAILKEHTAAPVQELQRYSPNGEGGMEVDSLGAYVKHKDVTTPPTQPAPVQEPVAWRYDLKQTGSFAGVSTEYSRIKLKIGENWTPLYTTPPAQPAVPDAMTSADIQEHIEYVAGWNDCRQTMLEMMK
jgi:hypothetical protein